MSSELTYIAYMEGPEVVGQLCESDFTRMWHFTRKLHGCLPEGARSDNGGMIIFDNREECEAAIKELLSYTDCPYTHGTVFSQRVTVKQRELKTIYRQ